MAKNRPPGPKGSLLLGNLRELRQGHLQFYERCARKYGDVVYFRFGPRKVVQVNHPDLIEEVLVSNNRAFGKNFGHRMLEPYIGKGLVTAEGGTWLRQRRLSQPAFLKDQIASYADAIVACCERHIADWKDGETLDLHAEMMELTLQIASKVFFGTETPGDAADLGRTFHDVQELYEQVYVKAVQLPTWVPTPLNRRIRRVRRELDGVVYRLIEEARLRRDDNNLLSRMLDARDEQDGSRFTDQQLRDEMVTFILAGHETTALALSWMWYLVAQHARVEERLLLELSDVLADREPTAADVSRLRYSDMVVREAMRLYPPVYGFGREAREDCQLGGYDIRKGTNIFMMQWAVHRDERFFPEAHRFQPERWADEGANKSRPKMAYFPFGGGPRVCIGNTFAMLESILACAVIARRFHFELDPEHPVEPWPSITLRPRHGLRVTLRKREQRGTGQAVALAGEAGGS